ncbi:response regulator transcription factor [Paracoccus alkenifer]|uniref:Response regulator receiver domain-containing protein n=1 Tax=Paracoccus alkenifer TaxID=65735 RepID=A0A1H6K7A1_9RHOB|nr:response regulator [Paracoccus alkenifer]SEH68325.1 Response regulator receiver domain-containing protein [Paracoccus alkenifer]
MCDVLIAEDEPTILETLSFLLERAGWSVASVTDGAAVLDTVRRKRPQVLVLDVMLPGRSGLEILKALRADPEQADTPVLILTARGQSHDRQMALDLRADGFISKPFANDEVVDEVRRLLGRRAARTAALG